MPYPKISIITPSYNQGQYIEETILSIINQGYPNLEYIIVDGGSTDDTVATIKKYEKHIKYWVSEKDDGQADAINKGLEQCSGEIFNWINSDDYLGEGVLFKIAEAFENKHAGMVAGSVMNFDEKGNTTLYVNKSLNLPAYFSNNESYVYHQPGIWFRMELVKKVGKFNTELHYSFDQEHLLRCLMANDQVIYIRDVLVNFRLHGSSKTTTQFKYFYTELQRVYRMFAKRNAGHPLAAMAQQKSRDLNWTIMHQSITGRKRNRITEFLIIGREMLRNPARNLTWKNIGWLKHLLFGPKEKVISVND